MKTNQSSEFLPMMLVLLLIIVSLVVFSGGFTGLVTKKAVKEDVQLYISNKESVAKQDKPLIYAGANVYVTLSTGNKGTSAMLGIYEGNGIGTNRVDQIRMQDCRQSSLCPKNQVFQEKFRTQREWRGTYCVRVIERDTYKPTETCFEIIPPRD